MPKPGRSGTRDRSLHEELLRLKNFRPPIDFSPLQLEQAEVLQHGADLDARSRGDRTARIVRRHLDAVGFGHRRDAGELEQAAAVFDVGHDDVHGARAAERRETGHAEQDLSSRHRLLNALANLERLFHALGRNGLFVPGELLRLEPARDPLGERHVEKAVAINHQLDIRADCLAHRDDARDAVVCCGLDRRRRSNRAAGSHPTARL